ncbi:hypothetical protein A3Q56_07500 [Intoshia linei]|uniref:Uncharacterized protein n=1 Tax=Intoshia linei TaxID=1819745 RepID=A0A177ATS3_9BILA|nr:hypothetical protein A3Q56_07500 [Intoshia linei]
MVQAKIRLENLETKKNIQIWRKSNIIDPTFRTPTLLSIKLNLVNDTWKTNNNQKIVKVAGTKERPDKIGHIQNCGIEIVMSIRIFLR